MVVPAFEIIATVADSRAGDDGNYSNESPLDDLRPWIEAAGEAGLYVLLDLQPGRTDFLTQARLYEEFLRLPYVGLALDPEWRLGPDQFHLRAVRQRARRRGERGGGVARRAGRGTSTCRRRCCSCTSSGWR